MALNLEYEFLFLGREESSFTENYVCDLVAEHGKKAGYIFANVEIKNNPADAEVIGVSVYEVMQREFFKDLEMDPYERFESTLKELNRVLREFKSKKDSGYIGDLNIVVAAVVDGVLYITLAGESDVYLIRKRYLSIISDGLDDSKDEDVFSNIASGQIEANDFVFCSTTRLLRYISKSDFANIVRKGSVQNTLMELRDLVFTEILGKISVIGLCFREQKEEEEVFVEGESRIEEVLEIDNGSEFIHEENVMAHEDLSLEQRDVSALSRGKSKVDLSSFSSKLSSVFSSVSNVKIESRNKLLIGLLGIIFVLIVSIVFASLTSENRKQLESYAKVLEGVKTKIADAETAKTYDKETAADLLDKAYQEALEVHQSTYLRDEASVYLTQIEEVRDSLDNVQRVSSDLEYLDLSSALSSDVVGFVELGDRVFAYSSHELVEIVLDQLQEAIVVDSEEQIISAVGFEDRDSVVFLTESGKLIEYREGTISYMDTEDEQFNPAVSIANWGDRVYLLDDVSGQIWKYTFKTNSGEFSSAETYLAETDSRLIESKDLAIDASIYVLSMDGNILKFYGGEDDNLSIYNSSFNTFEGASQIYTRDDLNKVLVLDSEAGRVFVFEKDSSTGRLNYLSQYLFNDVENLRDLYVDAEGSRMYVVSSEKIYEVSI